mmetsp:Transcript_26378/g.40486  ORF Transcript_26378/g.40486 Transcript_26378/m.40486 type:complete len:324 (+) Transcript_26378:59-1030(+)|eukprot:CAMPEP_0195285162 /NCGR_PEP_ID=MMETSP0707-20130614/3100_1 /TAXON_ID=33640 /ORGANISM="Asterionellopsis glacialis, Strain CCMP134" /LENGTH=323 /DNA_ID=CAMNT_0040344617 /DNA_START=14 /DNA_END=988 /DNA_ORIENTATION=+
MKVVLLIFAMIFPFTVAFFTGNSVSFSSKSQVTSNPPMHSTSDGQYGQSFYDTALLAGSISSSPSPLVYNGPILEDPSQIVSGISLGELGLDLAVAPSTVAPGQLGLYAILSEDTDSATIPELTLMCGYSREGSFAAKDEGDKTVGFALPGPNTAVFYDRQLMPIIEALQLAAEEKGADKSCGLAGHVLMTEDANDADSISIYLTTEPEFKRYFVPALLNAGSQVEAPDITVQNFGQFSNDLAWSYVNPPQNKEEYDASSETGNVVQLVWRLEFDEDTNCLIPSWPVSVFARDVTFENRDVFMELGTRYGWNYWQATVNLDKL